jgi:cephalosporin-C deacetylase-like acetyl esterase
MKLVLLSALVTAVLCGALLSRGSSAPAADPQPSPKDYLAFVKKQAADLRAGEEPPASREALQKRNQELREHLLAAWGGFPDTPAPIDPQKHGELKRDAYRVEKITFQTRPGVRMTANAYVPDKEGKLPAILMVHGHWRGAKQDPVVQSRCIGAAKLGFFVLCVDAFGAGERGIGTALGEYHGDMTAATLLPVGLPLSGLQVYENLRAVDYLVSRPEVDAKRIGITGASGGGNQTMYAGAWDTRLAAVVPVCSVGNYQAYLGAACCMCEVVPGALRFTEEAGVLGLVAPRALMVVNATRDSFQFSFGEAKKSLALAGPIFKLHDKPANVLHAVFESPHDYSKAMRETMYGWMTLHLKGQGDGSPIREPEFKTEAPEDLRCFPGDTRPKDWITIPRFAAAEGRKRVATIRPFVNVEEFATDRKQRLKGLAEKVLGGFPDKAGLRMSSSVNGNELTLESEPGIRLTARSEGTGGKDTPLVVLLDLDGAERARSGELAGQIRKAGWKLLTLDLRATGALAQPGERVGRAPDHNTAEWGLWIGRPLLGQWVFDVRRLLDYQDRAEKLPSQVVVIGQGPAGLVALAAAALDGRITKVAAVGTLASYLSDEPYVGQRLGVMAPGMLREVGDVAHLAALAAPSRVVIAGGVAGNGKPLTGEQLRAAYRPSDQVYEAIAALLKAPKELVILQKVDAAGVLGALK